MKPASLSDNVSLGSGYKYNLVAGDYGKGKITATKNADTLTSNGKNLSIVAGTGNDSLWRGRGEVIADEKVAAIFTSSPIASNEIYQFDLDDLTAVEKICKFLAGLK